MVEEIGARHRHVLRNDKAMEPQIRGGLCQAVAQKEAVAKGYLAFGALISIGGRKHWLWLAVDQDGYVLDEIVQARRDTKAAKRLLVRLLKKQVDCSGR